MRTKMNGHYVAYIGESIGVPFLKLLTGVLNTRDRFGFCA